MITALFLIPALIGLICFTIRNDRFRRGLLVVTATGHLAMTGWIWYSMPPVKTEGWFTLDAPGLLILSITSVLFFAASIYAIGYLAREADGRRVDFTESIPFSNTPEGIFTGNLLLFLAAMSFVCVTRHFGLLWVAIEATTLASAPLMYFHRHHRSLEAAWKYLLICSVGIALALLGNFLLAIAASDGNGAAPVPLVLGSLVSRAAELQTPWLKAAFLFFLVGYGTKMGLAPLHTWLPDAHSESPSVVSALLSGALLNCAFLGILRIQEVLVAAGLGPFGRDLLLIFGLLSMAVAAVFIIGQTDYKRLLAYSSVEHMGILSLGIGLGAAGTAGAMLHAVNHSLTKAMLFLVSGNILAAYQSKQAADVRGLGSALPVSGLLWLAGFLALTGSPPFGPFLSELAILKAALDSERYIIAFAYLAFLAIVFAAMAGIILKMTQGKAQWAQDDPQPESWLAIVPPISLGLLVLLFGLYVPAGLQDLMARTADALGGA